MTSIHTDIPTKTILAFDTSCDFLSLALLRDNDCHGIHLRIPQGHSGQILPELDRLLNTQGIALIDCDLIAFGCGPGSFTGLRIAASIAQGLGFATDKPLVPVVGLQALARAIAVHLSGGTSASSAMPKRLPVGQQIAALLDARMGEVYYAVYEHLGDDIWTTHLPPSLAKPAQVIAVLRTYVTETSLHALGGNAFSIYSELAILAESGIVCLTDAVPCATDIAWLARQLARTDAAISPAEAQPIYVRNKVAQTMEERQFRMSALQAPDIQTE